MSSRKLNKNDYLDYCVIKTKDWVKSVIYLGNKIKEFDVEEEKLTKTIFNNKDISDIEERENNLWENMQKDSEFTDKFGYIEKMNQYFFAIALQKTIIFFKELKQIKEFESDVSDILNIIDYEIGLINIKNLRDMNEHELDYFKGNGRRPKEFEKKVGNSLSDATSSLVLLGETHWLGGHVEVIKTLELYEHILPKIEKIYDKYMSSI